MGALLDFVNKYSGDYIEEGEKSVYTTGGGLTTNQMIGKVQFV